MSGLCSALRSPVRCPSSAHIRRLVPVVGCTNAFMQLAGIRARDTEEIASVDSGRPTHPGERQSNGWIRRLQPERPVRTVGVVVLDIDPQHLLEVAAPDDQQPVQALGPHRSDPALRVGVGVRRLHRRDQHLGALGTEHVVEAAGELRVAVAQHEAQLSSSFAAHHQQVAGLLGDPQTVGGGGHPSQMDSPGVELDEEQHLQPPQPEGVDGEAVARHDPGRLLALECSPGRGHRPWRWIQSMTAEGGADRGC
jgi:hypothetical protein